MGRRKPSAAFSLFSFQDIITSVTAILILVMLLLSIELVTRRRQQAATDPDVTRRQMTATAENLESLVAGLRLEVTARRAKRSTRTREQAAREFTRVQAELDATRGHLDETTQTRAAVTRLHAGAQAVASANAANDIRLAQLERQMNDDRQQADQIEEANRKETDRQSKRKREIGDAPRSGTELVYNPQANSDGRAWLVELSAAGITAVLLGGDRTEQLGAGISEGSLAASWIDKLVPDGDYCLLLVRPSASNSLEAEVSQRLRDAGIRYGIDLIGEDQAVRDGSKTSP